jgi:hypothetical protein
VARFTVTVLPNSDEEMQGYICKVVDHLFGESVNYRGATERDAMVPAAAWITTQTADKTTQHVDTAGELVLP